MRLSLQPTNKLDVEYNKTVTKELILSDVWRILVDEKEGGEDDVMEKLEKLIESKKGKIERELEGVFQKGLKEYQESSETRRKGEIGGLERSDKENQEIKEKCMASPFVL